MSQQGKLVAIAFLTEASQLLTRHNQLLGPWIDNLAPKDWGISNFQGTGRRLPSLIAEGKVVNENCSSLSDLKVSDDLFNLERYTDEKLSNCIIKCKKSWFASEDVWILGFFAK